ncbi:uncharacterized protein EI97DRAFT_429431 [Westerdykella ornata]|uniref:Uncharacterized protein n=1 Tax=Westerdykella ornata TaxID=318751 RepID=A0A6A6JYS9_WESOR|nr:uncharacterized protein EI97DRAFT_429431 [Westerdykella ornata]KAF2281384.1 hypothetical protein EI97DRAFT_429431 [Westerdykella ornata]
MVSRSAVRPWATAFILASFLASLAHAAGETGSKRIESGQCPPDVEAIMPYSPFKPYFKFPMFKGNSQNCWVAADCLMEASGESRKQQFGAVALVMGLIPLTLKDIAWPERRIIHVTKRLHWAVQVFVLALGLVPLETGSRQITLQKSIEGSWVARACWEMRRASVVLAITICSILTVASYAGMVFMEIYSKRSALGCPFPFFVAVWYVVALVPASIHSTFAALRRSRYGKKLHGENNRSESEGAETRKYGAANGGVVLPQDSEEDNERKKKIVSAVQGADEDWPVQLSWGVYYIAGTLIFTSIMAVTVAELVCWVGLGFAITASSKLLGFFLCLVFEQTGVKGEGYAE